MADATLKCAICDREKETKPTAKGARLPPGWKRHGDDATIYCRDCWSKSFVLRAVTLPVATVVEGGEWSEFLDACKAGWRAAGDVANWAVLELARAESPRTAETERLPKLAKPYLYPGARAVAPALDPTSTVAVLHAVEGRYAKARLATMWFRTQSLPVYRYPCPVPIHNQSWDAVEAEGGRPCVSVRLGGRRWMLALGTHNRKRQLAAWRRIATGAAVKGELALIGQEVSANDNKQGGEDRAAGGGRRKTLRIMAKMVAWFPRQEAREREGVLYLRTDGESFWVYHVGEKGDVKHLKAEHVKRWDAQHRRRLRGLPPELPPDTRMDVDGRKPPPIPIDLAPSWEARHRRHLEGMSDDLKYEKRWPAEVRRQAGERQDLWIKKHRDRINSFCHEASAMLANFAQRQNVATVVYDDANRAFVERFPWFQLEQMLRYKLDERGIALEVIEKKAAAPVAGD
jgi:hypothetical protein